MNPKLQTTLTGLALALAAIHSTGTKLGHFGHTDFVSLAESVTESVLAGFTVPSSQASQ